MAGFSSSYKTISLVHDGQLFLIFKQLCWEEVCENVSRKNGNKIFHVNFPTDVEHKENKTKVVSFVMYVKL